MEVTFLAAFDNHGRLSSPIKGHKSYGLWRFALKSNDYSPYSFRLDFFLLLIIAINLINYMQ